VSIPIGPDRGPVSSTYDRSVPDAASADLRRGLIERLRSRGHLRDARVAAAFEAVPRELFLAGHVERHGLADAYRDDAIVTRRDPVTGAPTSSSSQPAIMAKMLEMLEVRAGQRVLEIGAGTGYNAALLAHLVGDEGRVTSVELDADTAVSARRALLAAGVPARVEVGDGTAGWADAAPLDAVIATASTDVVPRAWFDQLRPGGRLVVPLRLSRVVSWLQAVVAFRKTRHGFEQVAVTGGGFMALRPVTRPDPPRATPARLAVREVADGGCDRVLLEVVGPALAGLDRPARRKLIMTGLGFGRSRHLTIAGSAGTALLAYVALALPEERLVEITRSGGRATAVHQALGVVDAVDGSLAVVTQASGGGVRLDAYGHTGAERAVLSAADRWALVGRPRTADALITVRYGSVRPHGWRSVRRGDQWISLDWRRPPGR
jgi:protein-L-isoaspartate(D-aspartate) O-methyltransferase